MPELPEVEVFRTQLEGWLFKQRITEVKVNAPTHDGTQVKPDDEALSRVILGKEVTRVSRHAKYVMLHTCEDDMVGFHPRMSGRFELRDVGDATWHKHDRVSLKREDGARVVFINPRRFGRVYVGLRCVEQLSKLGPDALDLSLTSPRFHHQLRRSSRRIKAWLLDQACIGGVGNIYADESLFAAGITPQRSAQSLDEDESTSLLMHLRRILNMAIERQGTSFDSAYRGGKMQALLKVYGRGGQACVVCESVIEKSTVAGRSTHTCPQCQT